jgi:cytochrome P450
LSIEGERWEVQRRTLAPQFARRPFASFTNAMLVAADLLTDRWRRVELDTTVDVAAELTLLTLNVLALTMFSDGIGGDLDEFRSAMNAYFGSLGRIGAFDLLGVPNFVPRPGRRRLMQTMANFEEIIDDIIEVRRRRPDTSPDCDIP